MAAQSHWAPRWDEVNARVDDDRETRIGATIRSIAAKTDSPVIEEGAEFPKIAAGCPERF